jgi:hypothetical protein
MEETQQESSILHDMNGVNKQFPTKIIITFIILIVIGIGTGYFLSKNKSNGFNVLSPSGNGSTFPKGAVFGTSDTKTFKDTATGVLQAGGVDGEGQFHLVRPGGDNQNVYLISSVVDLSQFIGKKIIVNGQTQQAKKVGWLMDVGRVEVVQ